MTQSSSASSKADKLHWLKFNPTEWAGMFSELSDEEYGLLHRVTARLWATPGNRLTMTQLLTELRVKSGSRREKCLQGLFGYALKEDEDGRLYVPALTDAFAEAVGRSKAATAAAKVRWKADRTAPQGPSEGSAPADF